MPKGLQTLRRVVRPRTRLGGGVRLRAHVALAAPPSTPERAVPVTALDESWTAQEALPARRWKGALALFGLLSLLAYGATSPGGVDVESRRAAVDDSSPRAAPGAFGVVPYAEPMSHALRRSPIQVKSQPRTAR